VRWHGQGNPQVIRDIEAKFDQIFSPKREPYLYVGNQLKHPRSFIILGIFWPPAQKHQPSLFS
ncbi:MAG: hypothetical protein QF662_06700, partial [Phycisphaerae bacterium]|nr:hypothetical protein [Phycisphaerae bacterium]